MVTINTPTTNQSLTPRESSLIAALNESQMAQAKYSHALKDLLGHVLTVSEELHKSLIKISLDVNQLKKSVGCP